MTGKWIWVCRWSSRVQPIKEKGKGYRKYYYSHTLAQWLVQWCLTHIWIFKLASPACQAYGRSQGSSLFHSWPYFSSDLPILHHDIQYSPSKFLLFLPLSLYSRLSFTISFSLSVSFPTLPSYQKCSSCYGQCVSVKHFFGLSGIVSLLYTVGWNNLKGMKFSVIISLEFSLNLNSKLCTI